MAERPDRAAAASSPDDDQVAAWARVLSAEPASWVFLPLAEALVARGAPRRAALVLKAALEHHPHHRPGRLLLSAALLESGRERAAAREAARLLEQDPDDVAAMKLLAKALRASGQREEAQVILERAAGLAPEDPELAAFAPAGARPGGPVYPPRDANIAELKEKRSHSVVTGSFGSSVPFPTDPLAEPTVREVPLTVDELDPPEVFTSSHRVSIESVDLGGGEEEDAEDATRPMSRPPFEVASEGPRLFEAEPDSPPTVEVSPSLALEAVRLVEAGLIEAPRLRVARAAAPTPPVPVLPIRLPPSADEPTVPLNTEGLRQGATRAEAPPSIPRFTVDDSGPGDDLSFDGLEPTAAGDRAIPRESNADRPTTELLARGLAEGRRTPEVPLEPTRELSQTSLARPSVRPAPEAPSDPPVTEQSLDLPRFEWEVEDRPSTVQLPRRRSAPSVEQSVPVAPRPPARVDARPEGRPEAPRPPPPPADDRPARGQRDLLEMPLDPSDFKDMAPRPPPAAHDLPDDLNSRPVKLDRPIPGPRPDRRPPPPPSIAMRLPAAAPEPVRSPPPRPPEPRPEGRAEPRPELRPDPRPEGRAEPRPELRPEPRPEPRAPNPEPRAEPRPDRRRAEPARPPAQRPQPAFGADAPRAERAVEVGPASRSPTAQRPTVARAPTPPTPRRMRRWPLVVAGAAVLALASTFALLAHYRGAHRAADDVVERARRALNDDTYLGRVAAADLLVAGPESPSALGRAADAVVRLIGRDGLAGPEAARRALLARVEAERVGRDGERARLDGAVEALTEAQRMAPKALDTRLADVLLRLHRRELEAAQTALDALDPGDRDHALTHYLYAQVARAKGDRNKATDRAATARSKDAGFVPAQVLVLQLQAERGDVRGALEGLKTLSERHRSHEGVYIAYQRLRVQEGEDAEEAMAALRSLLEKNGKALSPDQRALIQDTLGLFYVRAGDIESARTAYTIATKTVPDDPRYSVGLARLDLLEYKLDQAEGVLREAARQHPNEPAFVLELARARLLRGDPSGALSELKAVAALDIDGLLLVARSQLDLADPNGALETLAQAEQQAPALQDVDYYRLLAKVRAGVTPEAALAQLREMQTPPPDGRIWDRTLPLRAYGMALAHRGDAEAAKVLAAATAADLRDYRAPFELCVLEYRRQNGREALRACRAALAVNPHHLKVADLTAEIAEANLDAGAVIASLGPLGKERTPEMTRRLARANLALGRPGDAAALAPERRAEAPEDATDRYVRGLVLAASDRADEALPLLQAAARDLSADPWAAVALANLLLDQGDARKAAAMFRDAARLSRLPVAALGAARAAMRNNDWKLAQTDAREAARQARRSFCHPRLLAEALALQGRAVLQLAGRTGQRDAARFFGEALRTEADLPDALVGQGLLAEQQGRLDEAMRAYARAIQVSPRDPEAHYLLGRLYLATPEGAERGRDLLARTRSLDPRGRFGSLAKVLLKAP